MVIMPQHSPSGHWGHRAGQFASSSLQPGKAGVIPILEIRKRQLLPMVIEQRVSQGSGTHVAHRLTCANHEQLHAGSKNKEKSMQRKCTERSINIYWGMVGEASKEVVAFEQDLGEFHFDTQKRRKKDTRQRIEPERSRRSVETYNRKSGCLS